MTKCYQCRFFYRFGSETRGECHVGPPTVNPSTSVARFPPMEMNGPTSFCGAGQPLENGEVTQVREKINPPLRADRVRPAARPEAGLTQR